MWLARAMLLVLTLSGGAAATQPADVDQIYRDAMSSFRAADYEQAALLFERVLTMSRGELAADSPDLATDLNNLGEAYRMAGRLDAAEPLLLEALRIDEQAYGPDHVSVAGDLNNLALLRRAQGRLAQAEGLQERALAILDQAVGPPHPDIARGLNNLALIYAGRGRDKEAVSLLRQAVAMGDATLGAEHPSTALFRRNLARLEGSPGAAVAEAPAAKFAPSAGAADAYRLHLASLSSAAAARTEWDLLLKAYPDILGGLAMTEQTVDLGERGIFHRLLAGPVGNRADAQSLCDHLAAADQYCAVMAP